MFEFKKNERLCSKKIIDQLFSDGKSILLYPIKYTFFINTQWHAPLCQVMFSVSKKRFKNAVHRNRIKRLVREAYRLNKLEFYNNLTKNNISIFLSISYIANNELPFHDIKENMAKGLIHVINTIITE